jgi:hypothetical protein
MGNNIIPVFTEGIIPVPVKIPDDIQESRPDLIAGNTRMIQPDHINQIRERNRPITRDIGKKSSRGYNTIVI